MKRQASILAYAARPSRKDGYTSQEPELESLDSESVDQVRDSDDTDPDEPGGLNMPDELETDIGQVYKSVRSYSDEKKYWLITNVHKPVDKYSFPCRREYGKSRSFQYSWLKEYSWLCYSPFCNGGFCLPCVLCAKSTTNSALGPLVTYPMTNFTQAKEVLKQHDKQATHTASMLDATDFTTRMKHGRLSVNELLLSQSALQVEENRMKLKSILETVILCGKQNIPLRGHPEGSIQRVILKISSLFFNFG